MRSSTSRCSSETTNAGAASTDTMLTFYQRQLYQRRTTSTSRVPGTYPDFVVAPAQGMLIFDGDCGFCTSAAQWISQAWRPGYEAVPWQHLAAHGLTSVGLTTRDAQEAAWWVDEQGRRFRGHRAIAKSLRCCHGWKSILGRLLEVPPLSWLSAALYPVVVRYRYRLPGGSPACRVAPPGPPPPPSAE
jgi:predicted DCC family thiol-disulfide oxidoreductase YuxK